MKVDPERLDNGILKLEMSGRLDVLGLEAIEAKFRTLTATPNELIVVDIARLSFIASLGIRLLLSSAKALSKAGGRLALCDPHPNVRHMLEISGMNELIPIHENLEGAVADLLGQDPNADR